jgi:phosphatidylserine/phosphatidylglycerophosphate/cardiolipin synthase-like enzyme
VIGSSSLAALLSAIEGGRSIVLASSLLHEGRLVSALEAAGDRGASVSVELEDAPYAGDPAVRAHLAEQNRDVVRALCGHHVAAHLRDANEAPLHLKAAIVDGVAYLDDRNWPERGGDSIVTAGDARDVAALRAALDGRPRSGPHLATCKTDALALEAGVLAAAPPHGAVVCETESIGGSPVVDALCARARLGERVRVLVDKHAVRAGKNVPPAAALRRLALAGAEVRVCDGGEKFALAGGQAWLGSANATSGDANALEWGVRTKSPALIERLQGRFEVRWARAEAPSQP